jgi:hypothetical protein
LLAGFTDANTRDESKTCGSNNCHDASNRGALVEVDKSATAESRNNMHQYSERQQQQISQQHSRAPSIVGTHAAISATEGMVAKVGIPATSGTPTTAGTPAIVWAPAARIDCQQK